MQLIRNLSQRQVSLALAIYIGLILNSAVLLRNGMAGMARKARIVHPPHFRVRLQEGGQGAAIGMITAGLMSLAFMGFAGLIKL